MLPCCLHPLADGRKQEGVLAAYYWLAIVLCTDSLFFYGEDLLASPWSFQ